MHVIQKQSQSHSLRPSVEMFDLRCFDGTPETGHRSPKDGRCLSTWEALIMGIEDVKHGMLIE